MSNTEDTPMDYKQFEGHTPRSENEQALLIANKALDVPNADPDDDLRTISRQFLRLYDVYRTQTESLLNAVDSIVIQISRLKSTNDPKLNPVIEDLETILKGPIPTRWSDENASLKLELQKVSTRS